METAHPTFNDFFTPWKMSFERSASLWSRQLETAERIGSANMSAFKAVVDASITAGRSGGAGEQKDALDMASSVSRMIQDAASTCPGSMQQYARDLNEDLATLAIKYVNRWGDFQVSVLDRMAAQAPAGLELPLKAMSQVVSTVAANQASLLEAFVSRAGGATHAVVEKRKKDLPAPIEAK